MEAADLVVINTCAIREAAEAKVVGRQGVLRALKAANPALRVVLTGCAVRERDRAGLARQLPGRRPVPAPRRGAGARRAARPRVRPGPGRRSGARDRRSAPAAGDGGTTLVKGVPVSAADHLAGLARGGRRRWAPCAANRRTAPGSRSSTAATRPAPTASSRSAAARSGAGRSTRSWTRRGRWRRPATARSRSSARTSTATATTCRPRRASPTPARSAGPGGGSTGAAGPTSPS